MCLAYRFKINDIYHYYSFFLIKIIIKQMPPAESSLCVKQQRLDSGKYNFDERPGRMVVAWQVFRKYGEKSMPPFE
jgi:hypothetical protein